MAGRDFFQFVRKDVDGGACSSTIQEVIETLSHAWPSRTALPADIFAMSKPQEVILAEIPGSCDNERLLVVHRHGQNRHGEGYTRIELRQQTWGEGIGWFTQNTMPLEPQQVGQLRGALGGPSSFASPTVGFGETVTTKGSDRPQLRIHAESA